MKRIILSGAWAGRCITGENEGFDYGATVPGCAISDFIKAGRLPEDLFWRDNADKVVEYENYDYEYKKTFAFSGDSEGAILRFERIDTYADVYLNGVKVYHSENGNIRHDIDVSGALSEGENEITVKIFSPTK